MNPEKDALIEKKMQIFQILAAIDKAKELNKNIAKPIIIKTR